MGWSMAGIAVAAVASVSALSPAVSPAVAADAIGWSDAQVMLPVMPGRPGGAFVTLKGAGADDALTGATSPVVERIEIHDVTRDGAQSGAIVRMRAVPALPLPAGGTLALQPGHAHMMLFGVKESVKPGDSVPLHLTFRSGRTLDITAKATVAGAPHH